MSLQVTRIDFSQEHHSTYNLQVPRNARRLTNELTFIKNNEQRNLFRQIKHSTNLYKR